MEECAKIKIRLHNYQESMIALKNLKAAYIGIGKFIWLSTLLETICRNA